MAGMKPQDLYALRWAASPRLSPDRSRIAFTVVSVDEESNSHVGDIYVVSVEGDHEPVRFTHSGKTSTNPRWSPDGEKIAFTSNRDGDTSQLYVIPAGGGEAVRLTDFDESVEDLMWSPDGGRIAVSVRVRDKDYAEQDDRKRRPRRLTRLNYKLDDVGWIADRPRHIFIIDASKGSDPRQLTSGEYEDEAFAWSPDGTRIAFVSARHADWDLTTRSDVYVVDSGGGEPERLTPNDAICGSLCWSPEGARIAYQTTIGQDWDGPRHSQIAVIDTVSGERELLTSDLDLNCAPYPSVDKPVWEGAHVYFCLEESGATPLYKVAADGSQKPERVTGGDLSVTGYDVGNGIVANTHTTPTAPAELYIGDRRVTEVSTAFTSSVEVVEPQRYVALSEDGSEVECWLMRPTGFEQGSRYPVLLSVHGGPFTQYGYRFFDEFQVYAGAGYVVLFCNPRGSSGYGEAWARAIRGPAAEQGPGMGSVDYEDVMACLETALERFDFCDPERLGVMGGSYGGFMTSWIVGRTDVFRAALSERAVNNWVSFFGSSDAGPSIKGEIGAWPFEDIQAHLRISPTSYASSIETPLLIMHSEDDLRCDIEQAQHLFAILRLRKKEVELVSFPAESHELTRSGSPAHRLQRFEIILEWFERYLT